MLIAHFDNTGSPQVARFRCSPRQRCRPFDRLRGSSRSSQRRWNARLSVFLGRWLFDLVWKICVSKEMKTRGELRPVCNHPSFFPFHRSISTARSSCVGMDVGGPKRAGRDRLNANVGGEYSAAFCPCPRAWLPLASEHDLTLV